ncbi:uncharacterized protein LOC115785346 [Archocentrus centrarchus]|uniref:uncharacterized protein LOC115785346 n=1 Tax=Archocentrus centrarchus TaxID=63155 RepID=UPI0011EA1899|nr:uncharacterized protein LOC115785346 [Archocentrus centrarchus]
MMGFGAGFLKLASIWMVILMQGLDAGHAPKKHATCASCSPKHLTDLTKTLVNESLHYFDEANGKVGTWPPGFPELQVQNNFPPIWEKVHCSLLFMYEGLKKIFEDQKSNLNPQNIVLHKLKETTARVELLADCVENTSGGHCPQKPSPPKMPKHVFERKQWSHTLLKTARDYLVWLERKLQRKVKETKKLKPKVTNTQNYLEGNGYLL